MNNSTLPVCADQSLVVQKTIVGICYSLMCIAGILAYSLFIVVVSSYKSTTFKNSFYTLALSLAVPDILTLLGQLFYCVPAIFHCDLPVGYEFYAGLLVNTSWYILSTHMIIISVNRFVAVVLNYHYAEWFSFWRTYLMIAASISYGIIMRSIFHYSSCSYMYWGYGWDIKCESEFGKSFINVDTALGEATVVFIVLIYIWIFVYVKVSFLPSLFKNLIGYSYFISIQFCA